MLEHGAAINAKSDGGFTPLMIAAYEGSSDCVKLLLMHGAEVNAKDDEGDTALHVAVAANRDGSAEREHVDVVKTLKWLPLC